MAAPTPVAMGLPGTVTVKGRAFAVAQPTAADLGRIHEKMRDLATAGCANPLAAVNAAAEGLAPAVLSEAIRHAVSIGSGGGVEPTREAVFRTYDSLDGVRFRLWYLARKCDDKLPKADVDALVGEDDRYEVADALAAATAPAAGPDSPKAPPAGASG
jgi:hypothetical protein